MLWPFALFGSFARVFLVNVFYGDGFLNNVLYLDQWVPKELMQIGGAVFTTLSSVSIGMMGLVAAFGMAHYTARIFKKDDLMSGITGAMTILISAYQIQRIGRGYTLTFNYQMLDYSMLLYGILLGFIVGLIFKHFGPDYHPLQGFEHGADVRRRTYQAGLPITISLLLGMVICLLINGFDLIDWAMDSQASWQSFMNRPHNFGLMILLSMLSALLEWMGFSAPLHISSINETSAIAANLNYALVHGSSWNIPYKYLWSSLYSSYCRFGGTGLIFPLLIALLIVSRRPYDLKLTKWTIIPSIFNSNYAVMTGLPVILNPLYIIPYVLLPIVNLMLAVASIALHLIPASAYLVPVGTPGGLYAFIATNGSWQAILFAFLLFLFDILAYMPFVRWAAIVNGHVHELQQQEATIVDED